MKQKPCKYHKVPVPEIWTKTKTAKFIKMFMRYRNLNNGRFPMYCMACHHYEFEFDVSILLRDIKGSIRGREEEKLLNFLHDEEDNIPDNL